MSSDDSNQVPYTPPPVDPSQAPYGDPNAANAGQVPYAGQAPYGAGAPGYAPAYAAAPKRTTGIGSLHKDKWVAAVLAFVLPWTGLHKFYLGYKTEGIIMLVVALVGSLCLGLGMAVMCIVGFIEAVRYVILTQEDFEQTYVRGYKPWF